MGCDRYGAICNPPRYTDVVSRRVCAQLMCGTSGIRLATAVVQVTPVFALSFCHRVAGHFFCNILPVLKPSCMDITIDEIDFVRSCVILVPVGLGLHLLHPPHLQHPQDPLCPGPEEGLCHLHLPPRGGHCPPWLVSSVYLKPMSEGSIEQDLSSVTYTTTTPLLDPGVYSLRKNEVKDALTELGEETVNTLTLPIRDTDP
ncbi:unnamed protein product [Gulo gulo]|uniref:Uncharacterized protein n=1 Tax=Gulo gulo TaxID=48420 RepID=A0A9X9PX22_GULGU|nr:unnamed protein product [Gulo gulo]